MQSRGGTWTQTSLASLWNCTLSKLQLHFCWKSNFTFTFELALSQIPKQSLATETQNVESWLMVLWFAGRWSLHLIKMDEMTSSHAGCFGPRGISCSHYWEEGSWHQLPVAIGGAGCVAHLSPGWPWAHLLQESLLLEKLFPSELPMPLFL